MVRCVGLALARDTLTYTVFAMINSVFNAFGEHVPTDIGEWLPVQWLFSRRNKNGRPVALDAWMHSTWGY